MAMHKAIVRWTVIRRTVMIWIAGVFSVLFVGGIWHLLLPHYLEIGSKSLFERTFFWTSVLIVVFIMFGIRLGVAAARKESRSHGRAAKIFQKAVDKVCRINDVARPEVTALDDIEIDGNRFKSFAALADLSTRQDVVLIGEKLADILDESELESVVAHELHHSDHLENKLLLLPRILRGATATCWLVCGLQYLAVAAYTPEYGFLHGLGAVIYAWVLMRGGFFLSMYAEAVASRHREFICDAQAAMDVGSPEPLISALAKISKAMAEECTKKKTVSAFLRSHPSLEKRTEELRRLAA